MRVSTSYIFALCASPLLALAQSNPFNIPTAGLSATAGQPLDLSWKPTTSGTVSLILRTGASSDLSAGTYIAQSISNSGSYTWTPSTMITRGSDYTVEIVSDSDPSETNYTPYFVIDSTNTVAYSTSEISLGAPSSTISASTASATGSATSVSGIATTTTTGSAINSATSSSSGGSAATSSSKSSAATSSGSMTTSASSSGAAPSSTLSGASFESSTTSAAAKSSSSSSASAAAATGAAPRATAAAGLMGLVALGALAL